MRKLLVGVLVGGAFVLSACMPADRPDEPPAARPTPDRSARSVAAVPDDRPPRACAGHDPLRAELDGDDEPDWVYLDWVEDEVPGHAELGWCTKDRHGSFATEGMAETLSLLDLYGDGRHEVLFGGTTCCARVLKVAVYSRGRVRVVDRTGGRALVLSSGLAPEGDREYWTVYGCDADAGGALTQVVVRLRGDELRIRRTRYEIDGATAQVISRKAGTIPDPGPRLRARDVSETVGGCIEVFDAD